MWLFLISLVFVSGTSKEAVRAMPASLPAAVRKTIVESTGALHRRARKGTGKQWSSCKSNADCAAGLTCIPQGSCELLCNERRPCPPSQTCSGYTCVPQTRDAPGDYFPGE
jgi:hypothetical protein